MTSKNLSFKKKDERFSPICSAELPLLEVEVSLLHSFENGTDVYDWDVGTHGIQISFMDDKYEATFLPSVAPEQGWVIMN